MAWIGAPFYVGNLLTSVKLFHDMTHGLVVSFILTVWAYNLLDYILQFLNFSWLPRHRNGAVLSSWKMGFFDVRFFALVSTPMNLHKIFNTPMIYMNFLYYVILGLVPWYIRFSAACCHLIYRAASLFCFFTDQGSMIPDIVSQGYTHLDINVPMNSTQKLIYVFGDYFIWYYKRRLSVKYSFTWNSLYYPIMMSLEPLFTMYKASIGFSGEECLFSWSYLSPYSTDPAPKPSAMKGQSQIAGKNHQFTRSRTIPRLRDSRFKKAALLP